MFLAFGQALVRLVPSVSAIGRILRRPRHPRSEVGWKAQATADQAPTRMRPHVFTDHSYQPLGETMDEFNPYERFDSVPSFTLTSTDIAHGKMIAAQHRAEGAGGSSLSPQLSWSGFPSATKSFAITCYDPDAPTGSGFWHWAVYNVPASVTSVDTSAGSAGGVLPPRSLSLKNELRRREYTGAEPPEATGVHRYVFAVHAVDVDHLDLDPESTPAVLGFNLHFHTLARALLVATAAFGDKI
jgi:Raf kinase inhibitor-like YbhB/YbcL family protein